MTHYRKAFDSPYLSSADIVGPTVLTIDHVRLEPDRTKRTKDKHNTAHFVEREIRPGEPLKPMILNATNSKTLFKLTGEHEIEKWNGVRVTICVDRAVKFGSDIVEGLRIDPNPPAARKTITPALKTAWANAKEAYKRDGNLDKVLARADMSQEHQEQLKAECDALAS